MRIPRVYHDGRLSEGAEVTLDEAASVHVQRVLRLRRGDALRVFNGAGGEFEAVIEGAERGRARLRIGRHDARDPESTLALTLAQGISRGERMDLTLQKSVELGVARIVPLVTAYCQVRLEGERLERRHRHWQGVIRAACEQSGRTRLPELAPAAPLQRWLAGARGAGEGLRLVLDPRAEQGLSALASAPGEARGIVTLLIGPEGGLDEAEIDAARQAGFQALRLGPRILRTETAGIAALAALQALWGDLA